jgi:predicted metal-dependent phosphoesterase TrpH
MPYINFYLDYFAQGKVAYVKLDYMDFGKAIAMIKSNGGIPVVAHPGMNLKGSEEKIVELLDLGAEGVEVFNNYHDENQISYFTEIAVERNILATCGSDFHGKNKPLIRPGSFKSLDRFESYVAACVEKIAQFSH